MSEAVINAEKLSKYYRLGLIGGGTLREDLSRWWAMARGKPDPLLRIGTEDHENREGGQIWALRDVSFDVKEGEILGIIGRNGAGKSTLLKILSRITAPTGGTAEVTGRVGSLLEVGTGFHPELTGRENAYLNGAILGMSEREIDGKFDEIVAFAEIDQFIDTPVKRYSSGMYVRLAFAVAAHLEPEILIIDEVLAVGDAAFQKKCLGKMQDVSKHGRTVLFVSHNMIAVRNLCSRAMWLSRGRKVADGDTNRIVADYLVSSQPEGGQLVEEWKNANEAPGNDMLRVRRVACRPRTEEKDALVTMATPLDVEIEFWNRRSGSRINVSLYVYTEDNIVAFQTGSAETAELEGKALAEGLYRNVCTIPGNLLNSGSIRFVVLWILDRSKVLFRHESAVAVHIADTSKRGGFFGRKAGIVHPLLEWKSELLHDGQE